MEAMSTGLPVIVPKGEAFVTRLERERACVSTGRTVEELCHAVTGLLETHELASTLSARARQLAVREWSQKVMINRYLRELYGLAASRIKAES
jgi:glycosyltransferase involved in cell wall biosynthesis